MPRIVTAPAAPAAACNSSAGKALRPDSRCFCSPCAQYARLLLRRRLPVARFCGGLSAPIWVTIDVGIVMQNDIQQRAVNFQVAVVVNQAQFSELIHEKVHARSCR